MQPIKNKFRIPIFLLLMAKLTRSCVKLRKQSLLGHIQLPLLSRLSNWPVHRGKFVFRANKGTHFIGICCQVKLSFTSRKFEMLHFSDV